MSLAASFASLAFQMLNLKFWIWRIVSIHCSPAPQSRYHESGIVDPFEFGTASMNLECLTRNQHLIAPGVIRLRLACLLVLFPIMPAIIAAADLPDRTLLSNRAVQRELRLSLEQREKIAVILAEVEAEIARAKKDAGQEAAESDIADALMAKQGPRFQQVLTPQQSLRIWQIGLQASGPGMFHSSKVQQALDLSPEQQDVLKELSEKLVSQATAFVTDSALDIETVKAKVELARRTCFISSVAILSPEQKSTLRELIGKPFDLETLKPGYQVPRPLTFVYGVTGRNGFLLVRSRDVMRELKLSESQFSDLQTRFQDLDRRLTEARLAVLKPAAKDFPDMTLEEQKSVVRAILDSSRKIVNETRRDILGILAPEQAATLDKQLVRVIGARSIEADSIARRLKLTDDQKIAVAKRIAEFDEATAPLRVVQVQADFDSVPFDKQLATLEADLRSLLSSDQANLLVEIGK